MAKRIACAVVVAFLAAPALHALDVSVAFQVGGQDTIQVAPGESFTMGVVLAAEENMVSAQLMVGADAGYFNALSATWATGWDGLLNLSPRPQGLPTQDIGAHAADLEAGTAAGYLAEVVIEVDAATPPGTYELTPQELIVGDLSFEDAHVAASRGLTVVVQGAGVAPALVSAVSERTHGGAGTFGIDVSGPEAVESRSGGPQTLVVTFDGAIQNPGGAESVTASSGSVSDAAASGSSLTIQMSGAANAQPLTIAFPGIVGAAGGGSVTDVLCFGVLGGDLNADRSVNVLDLVAVRNELNQPVTTLNFIRDVNADGQVNVLDLVAVRNSLNSASPACP